MVRPAPTAISCPACRQSFNAILEQILDVGVDPSAKERLLGGRVNLITCPHCGYRGVVGTPLMYHDASKPLAIVYIPMELNLQQHEREKLIGDMTNRLMRSLPEDAPKGHLLQPKVALTLQGMIEQILEADGITPEMIQAERRKVDLINQLADVDSEQRERLLAENQELLDLTFIELLTAAAQAASQAGDERRALRLLNTRTYVMQTTEVGRNLQAQQDALIEASRELKSLGERLTREAFVDLLVNAVDNPYKVDALATLGRTLLDYTTFQELTSRIDKVTDPAQKQKLIELREHLLEMGAEFERQTRARIDRAIETLRALLQASDVRAAIQSHLDRIDDLFLQVLQANLDEARRAGNLDASNRLRLIRDEVLRLIQESAPPEIRLINELLSVESEEQSIEILRSRQSEVTQELVDIMGDLAGQLREGGNDRAAQRLDALRAVAERMI